jgi:ferredoxin
MSAGPGTLEYVRFREDLCTGCAACLRSCPTQAIRIRQHKSVRITGQCIGCGSCIRACPAGAVAAATAMPELSPGGPAAIAFVSPVLYAQFPRTVPANVLLGLRQMGFAHTIDMSFFLEMFQRAAEEFIRRNRAAAEAPWPLISPVCPVVLRLIAFRFPSLLDHVLPILRPVALMAREVEERLLPEYAARGEKSALCFINPCPTLAGPRPVSGAPPPPRPRAAVGVNEIYPALKAALEKILAADALPFTGSAFEFESCTSGNAALAAMTGGEISGMDVERTLAVHGLGETVAYLHKIEMGLLSDVEYIEFRACHEGCLGGVLTAVDKYVAKRNVQAMVREVGLGSRLPRETVLRLYAKGRFRPDRSPARLTRIFGTRQRALTLKELNRIEELLERIEGRDCGACGAPDCRAFAEDVVRGAAALEDCIWLRAGLPRRSGTPPHAGGG